MRPAYSECPDLTSTASGHQSNPSNRERSSKQHASKIPLPKLSAGNPIKIHEARTYLDEDSDVDPYAAYDYTYDDDLSSASSSCDFDELDRLDHRDRKVEEEEEGHERKSNESLNIVRARTPTVIEVDGGAEGGVIGLGLGLQLGTNDRGGLQSRKSGAKRCGTADASPCMPKSSNSLRRGRSVEGLLEIA